MTNFIHPGRGAPRQLRTSPDVTGPPLGLYSRDVYRLAPRPRLVRSPETESCGRTNKG